MPVKDSDGCLRFADYPTFRPNLTPKEVLQAGSFGGTYFRSILSGITGLVYTDAWKEFPVDWFDGMKIEEQVASSIIRASVNKYGGETGCSLDMWESSGWITHIDPYGWFQWYCRFYLGRRSSDDGRQVKRWCGTCGPTGRFKLRLITQLLAAGGVAALINCSIGVGGRQGMQHWGYELTRRDFEAEVARRAGKAGLAGTSGNTASTTTSTATSSPAGTVPKDRATTVDGAATAKAGSKRKATGLDGWLGRSDASANKR